MSSTAIGAGICRRWKNLRQSVGWRGHAQKNPLQEYRRESFEMFNRMLDSIKSDIARVFIRAPTIREEAPPAPPPAIEAPPPPRPTIDFDARRHRDFGRNDARAHGRDAAQSRPQHAVPVRIRQKIQALPRETVILQCVVFQTFLPALYY